MNAILSTIKKGFYWLKEFKNKILTSYKTKIQSESEGFLKDVTWNIIDIIMRGMFIIFCIENEIGLWKNAMTSFTNSWNALINAESKVDGIIAFAGLGTPFIEAFMTSIGEFVFNKNYMGIMLTMICLVILSHYHAGIPINIFSDPEKNEKFEEETILYFKNHQKSA